MIIIIMTIYNGAVVWWTNSILKTHNDNTQVVTISGDAY